MNKRINEISGRPIGEYLSRDISDFQRVSRTLFECFSSLATGALLNPQQLQQIQLPTDQISSTATPNMVLQLMNHLIDVDKSYQNSLKKLQKHQKIQKEITDIQKEIEEKDKLISTLALNLKDIESFLENELSQDNVNINNGNTSDNMFNEVLIDLKQPDDAATVSVVDNIVNREVSPEDLISYAHKISGTTSAPFGYQPNAPLASLFKPPAPQDEMMRSSVLFTKPPPHVLKYYGLTEIDVTTPTMAANIASPFSMGGGTVGGDTTPTSKEQEEQQQQQQQQQQPSQQQQQQPTDSDIQPIQSILQPPQQLNIDLDLNPDLDSSGEDDEEDDDDDEESEEVEWD